MKNISRRNFLKGSAAMGILAAMGGAGTAIAEGSSAYTFADTVKWDAEYDVVVLGLGFAGMTAAVTAADAGAKVLIAEKMSEALAGVDVFCVYSQYIDDLMMLAKMIRAACADEKTMGMYLNMSEAAKA